MDTDLETDAAAVMRRVWKQAMRLMMRQWLAAVVMAACLAGAAGVDAAAGGGHGVDLPIANDPPVGDVPREPVFDLRLKGLWEAALHRPEAELRMHALDAMVMARTMPGLDTLVDDIAKVVSNDKEVDGVRLSAVRALDALDAKGKGKVILDRLKQAGAGATDLSLVADAALARWQVEGAAELWLSRIDDAKATQQTIESAMRSLGTAKAPAAIEPLKKVAGNEQRPIATRLTAARALANFPPASVFEFAKALSASKNVQERLLATWMLPTGKDPQVVGLLTTLTSDGETAVVAVAAKKLWEGSPEAMAGLDVRLANSVDGAVRRVAADALHFRASTESVAALGKLLNDDLPRVREAAREALIELDSKPALRSAVRRAATDALRLQAPHAQEQACFVLGTLHENSARDRLVELLSAPEGPDAPKSPVRLAVAVALRRLNTEPAPVSDTLQAQYERAKVIADTLKTVRVTMKENEAFENELSQLLQNLGIGNYTDADGLMRRFIAKNCGYGPTSRSGAIWALGKLHQDKLDAGLARLLTERLNDNDPRVPEVRDVKAASAVALGRMRYAAARSSLGNAETAGSGGLLGEAARWALLALDRKEKEFKVPPPVPNAVRGWFIEPME